MYSPHLTPCLFSPSKMVHQTIEHLSSNKVDAIKYGTMWLYIAISRAVPELLPTTQYILYARRMTGWGHYWLFILLDLLLDPHKYKVDIITSAVSWWWTMAWKKRPATGSERRGTTNHHDARHPTQESSQNTMLLSRVIILPFRWLELVIYLAKKLEAVGLYSNQGARLYTLWASLLGGNPFALMMSILAAKCGRRRREVEIWPNKEYMDRSGR